MKKKNKIILVDRIDVFSIAPLLRLARGCTQVLFYEPMAPMYNRVFQFLKRIGLFGADFHEVPHTFNEMRDADGKLVYFRTLEEALELSRTITKEAIAGNAVLEAAAGILGSSKVYIYIKEMFRTKVRPACLQVVLAQWRQGGLMPGSPQESCHLLIRKDKWTPFIIRYAQRKGVAVYAYPPMKIDLKLRRSATRVIGLISKVLRKRFSPVSPLAVSPSAGPSVKVSGYTTAGDCSKNAAPKLASNYSYRKVTLDPNERSEFFWLEGSGVPLDRILLYGPLNQDAADPELIRTLKQRGLQIIGKGPYATPFRPSARVVRIFAGLAGRMAIAWLRLFFAGSTPSLFYLLTVLVFFAKYAYWLDFFQANRVRVNLAADAMGSVASVMALDALGGISASYQYSSGVLNSPWAVWTSGENVHFLFSERFEEKWRRIDSPVERYVFTGFIDDYYIDDLKKRHPEKVLRKMLEAAGAKFIICFFDEHSTERWDHFADHESAADDYRKLLLWLLADESIGLIFKPKKGKTLFERIQGARPLIDKALKTGRCVFLGSDTHVGSVFPAEAAYNADVCIAKLVGTAAALEATLLGVDTFLLDKEGLRTPEFVKWGEGRFLFYNWDTLRARVDDWRQGIGRERLRKGWGEALAELDHYRDGQARLRIGRFLGWALQGFSSGLNRDEALRYAVQKFEASWPVRPVPAGEWGNRGEGREA